MKTKTSSWLMIITITAVLLSVGAMHVGATEKIVIRWQDWGDKTQMACNEAVKAAFEAKYPNIEVQLEYTSGDDWIEKTTAQMVAGVAPDVITGWMEPFQNWAQKGQFLDLNSYIEMYMSDEEVADFWPSLWNAFNLNGKQWALPKYVSAMALYYNQDAFDEVGLPYPQYDTWTWDTFLTAAKKLTKVNASGNITRWAFVDYWTQLDRICSWIWQNGGRVRRSASDPTVVIDEPAAVEALQFAHDLIWKYKVAPNTGQMAGAGPETMFINQQVAMIRDGSWSLPWYSDQAKFRWDVAHFAKGKERATMHTIDGYAVYKKTKHPREAFLLARFAASTMEGQIPLMKNVAMPSGRKSISEQFVSMWPEKNARVFLDAMEYARVQPLFPQMGAVMEVLTPALERAITLNKEPVDEAMKKAAAEINKILGKK